MNSGDYSEIEAGIAELESLSDRAATVLGFALFDAVLERWARRVVAEPSDEIFTRKGFLRIGAD